MALGLGLQLGHAPGDNTMFSDTRFLACLIAIGLLISSIQKLLPGILAELRMGLVGAHQADNAVTAASAALALRQQGFDRLSVPAILAGLSKARLPGRFQVALTATWIDGDVVCTLATGSGGSLI